MTQLICDDVRFSCVNTLAKGGKQVVLQTEGGTGGMRAAIASVFGAKQLQELVPLSASSEVRPVPPSATRAHRPPPSTRVDRARP